MPACDVHLVIRCRFPGTREYLWEGDDASGKHARRDQAECRQVSSLFIPCWDVGLSSLTSLLLLRWDLPQSAQCKSTRVVFLLDTQSHHFVMQGCTLQTQPLGSATTPRNLARASLPCILDPIWSPVPFGGRTIYLSSCILS